MESFSKLADSIYFWKDSESRSNSNSTSDAQGAGSALAGVQAKIAVNNSSSEGPPELYVNQIVSSTLHWRHMGVTVTQTAELYSTEDNVARSTLKITCADAPSSTTNNAKGNARGSGCQIPAFNLLWRVPSWVPAQGLMVSLNGIAMDDLPRVKGAHGGGRMSAGAGEEVPLWFRPPQFGDGADYVVVGPEWHEGDTGE